MYADDAKLYAPIQDERSEHSIQADLDRVSQWCKAWRLNLNADKCFFLHYQPRNCRSAFPTYKINGINLDRKSSTSDLGVIISDSFKFHDQVKQACMKANRAINNIWRSFISRNPQFLSSLYKSYVRPHLEYCVQLWNPVYTEDIHRMEKVQNRFTRLLL